VKRPAERVEDEPQILEGHYPQKRLVPRFSQNYRGVAFALRQDREALRDPAANGGTVGKSKRLLPRGGQPDSFHTRFGSTE